MAGEYNIGAPLDMLPKGPSVVSLEPVVGVVEHGDNQFEVILCFRNDAQGKDKVALMLMKLRKPRRVVAVEGNKNCPNLELDSLMKSFATSRYGPVRHAPNEVKEVALNGETSV